VNKEENASQRILKMALKEFSTYGFSGARMERIAKAANINKAMIFYYFTSKKKLYQLVVLQVLSNLYPKIMELLSSNPTAEVFLEKAPEIYMRFFSRKPDFVKMKKLIRKWYKKGLISEADPLQFMLNVVSLSLFSFIGKPFLEVVFQEYTPPEEFEKKRIKSIVNLLKRGMLT
jgi:TetR/AcrR family transcriptional regulator